MLNSEAVQGAMTRRGLHQSALAEQIGVSKESVSKWLSGQTIPRPDKVRKIADVLGCSVDDILKRVSAPAPVVAFRTLRRRPVSDAALSAAQEIGAQLRQLTPFVPKNLTPRRLDEPSTDSSYVSEAVAEERGRLGLGATDVPTLDQVVELLVGSGAILVPVLWAEDKAGQENALSIVLEQPRSAWVLFSLGCYLDDIKYWLAHELGHCLTLHKLQDADGERFAELFAQEFLFPGPLAQQCYAQVQASAENKLETAANLANEYGISLIHVVRGIDRFAAATGQPETGLDNDGLYDVWKAAQKESPTMAAALWAKNPPSAETYVETSEKVFRTPVFRAFADWQAKVGGASPAFIASTLNIGIGQAYELSMYLAQRQLTDGARSPKTAS